MVVRGDGLGVCVMVSTLHLSGGPLLLLLLFSLLSCLLGVRVPCVMYCNLVSARAMGSDLIW